jgi:DNA-binding transcriptional MerR regulator
MTIKEWQELGYNLAEAKSLVELEGYEKLYEEFAHMVFYSKNL